MIYGRLIGIFCAVVLASSFHNDNIAIQIFVWLLWTAVAFLISIAVSLFLGVNVNTDQPNYMDGQKYWTDKYGDDLGKEAYKMWLEELDSHE